MNKRLKIELMINDLFKLMGALDKGNQLGVMYHGQLKEVVEYDDVEKKVFDLIFKEAIRTLNTEIKQISEVEDA